VLKDLKKNIPILLILILFTALIPTALSNTAFSSFRRLTSTELWGLPTWDSDMINIEAVDETGEGVYIAVLDTGLAPNWRDYFPADRIMTKLGKGFYEALNFYWEDGVLDCEVTGRLHQTSYIGSVSSTHGTHVTSTIIGYYYDTYYDSISGYPMPPIIVRGIAPNANIIPVKVLADYTVPANPKEDFPEVIANLGTDDMIAAGINYATNLAIEGYTPMIITMSLGGPDLSSSIQEAIDRAIINGVVVVAAAGNAGSDGMDYPGAYPPVISVGANGWTQEWLHPGDGPFNRLWWLQSDFYPYSDIVEPTPVDEIYIPYWTSRELSGQDLDVVAPGSWVRGPCPGFPGYAHLPWWSRGIAEIIGHNPGNFYYLGGTSMATPHVAGVAAMMLEKNPALDQAEIESILEATAIPIPPGSAIVFNVLELEFSTQYWGVDATGSGLVQADAAIAAVP
jgi:subtilisin family serine protease